MKINFYCTVVEKYKLNWKYSKSKVGVTEICVSTIVTGLNNWYKMLSSTTFKLHCSTNMYKCMTLLLGHPHRRGECEIFDLKYFVFYSECNLWSWVQSDTHLTKE